ncbi:hypothetical protein NS365_02480 [Aureimonas ureilytica]|uniref:HTH araC/xylS-type domain-containing protein n=1 Tax=Aureimonas ureilytica TaxID=401562 RepID=A0A175RXW9_9HYPH|nr:AraC family transcriptional regulator [Aureimonas ureilytica]KTR07824.1 hypothetical protein NS365_02480 [Aureimonas ureilytica]
MNHPVLMERRGQFETPGEAEALRAFLTPLFDLTLMHDAPVSISCHARATGGGLVVRLDAGSLELERAVGAARRGGWDHRLVLLVSAGSCDSTVREHVQPLRSGDIALFDMARSFSLSIQRPASLVLLFLPRSTPLESLPPHGRHLPAEDVMNGLIVPPIRLLADGPAPLSPTEASALIDAIALLAQAPPPDAPDRLTDLWALLDACATNAEWPPGRMAAALGLSRTGLYRLATSEGGVSAMRQDARLRHAVMLLLDPSGPVRAVADVALASGFASPAHFSRLFRQRFSLSPLEFRTRVRYSGEARLDPRFALWLERGLNGVAPS